MFWDVKKLRKLHLRIHSCEIVGRCEISFNHALYKSNCNQSVVRCLKSLKITFFKIHGCEIVGRCEISLNNAL